MASKLVQSIVGPQNALCFVFILQHVASLFTVSDSMEAVIFLWHLLTGYWFHSSGYGSWDSCFYQVV